MYIHSLDLHKISIITPTFKEGEITRNLKVGNQKGPFPPYVLESIMGHHQQQKANDPTSSDKFTTHKATVVLPIHM